MSVRKGGREGRLLMFCAQRRINQPLQHSAICLEVFGLCFSCIKVCAYKCLYEARVHMSHHFILGSLWTGPKALISEWAFITFCKARLAFFFFFFFEVEKEER